MYCPVLLPSRNKPCPAPSNPRKPLSLWRKSGLSTVWWPFTITTNLYTSSYFYKTKKHRAKPIARQQACTPCLVYKKKGRSAATPGNTVRPVKQIPLLNLPPRQENRCFCRRLWKKRCISTAPDVQKQPISCSPGFCPTSVQAGYNAFPAHPSARKPLSL